jgi:phage terminase large subunit GpA-like protein
VRGLKLIAHTNSYGAKRKVSLFSSPTTDEESIIKDYYEQGDCRKFLIPCPVCGRHIELKLSVEHTAYGLKTETRAGEIIDAYYLCEYCGEAIFNEDKLIFYSADPRCKKHPQKTVPLARWEPIKKPDPFRPSYHINALYSPVGMLTFKAVAQEYIKKEAEGPDGIRSWTNIYAGLPYKDLGSRPRLAAVLNRRGSYARGTVPPGVLFLTMACDVQRGSASDSKNPPRIELEVMGTGLGYRTWSIEYRVFPGEVDNAYAGAWEDMYQWIKGIDGTFYSAKGTPFRIVMIGIDSGDAAEGRSETVYRFAERWSPLAFPLKGFAQLTARRGEKADIPISFLNISVRR